MRSHDGYTSQTLLVALVIILVIAFGLREALDKPGETLTRGVYCQDAPETSIEVCIDLELYFDGFAPSWMYEHDYQEPQDEALPPEEGA